jgi:uroporphyrinogen-III synthase
MRYIVLRVDSDAQAEMLVEDIRQNPHDPIESPRWHTRVLAVVAGVFPDASEVSA